MKHQSAAVPHSNQTSPDAHMDVMELLGCGSTTHGETACSRGLCLCCAISN